MAALGASGWAYAEKPPLPAGDFTVVLVGGARGDESSPTLSRLEVRLASLDPEHGLVVFTGNYSRTELPEKGFAGRAEAEREILAHVRASTDFVRRGGRVFFLAGDHDFAEGGARAVHRLRKFLNHAFNSPDGKVDVMPQGACGEPVLLELTEVLGLMLLNSQWWMQDWEVDPQSNQGCKLKTREALRDHVRSGFNDYRTRRLIVASHQPLRSEGRYGGGFAGLVPQYARHPQVFSYTDLLLEEADRFGAYFFASGHDASLQYLRVNRQTQIISGTSARVAEPVRTASEGAFTAAAPGWAELRIDEAGGGALTFRSGVDEQVLFQTPIAPLPAFGALEPGPAPPIPPSPFLSSYGRARGGKLGAVGKFFAGSMYGDAYELELPYPVLDLKTEEGGLTPHKAGGSLQTNALRLTDSQGGDWALRPTTKDGSRLFASSAEPGAAKGPSFDRAFTASQPEAALAVARLAAAVGVLHAEPRLMYLPDQDALGKFRGYLGNEVVLLERRANEPTEGVLPASLAGPPSPAGKTHFRDTQEMLAKVLDEPVKHRFDQEAMLRARLLDVFIGDWDRHDGQWRFAEIPNEDGTRTWEPIPRDRDQAFANYDGFLLAVARTGSSQTRKLQPFTADYGNLGWLAHGARNLDPILLNRLSRERWTEVALAVKQALTDAVIDGALATWHPEAYQLDGARIAADLKLRRDHLDLVAAALFDHVNRNAEIIGSKDGDLFELWFEPAGAVRVSVQPAGGDGPVWFDRVYEPEHTSELQIYAREGDDLLRVHGTPSSAIVIRFVGGEGFDRVTAATPKAGQPLEAPAIRFYDTEQGAELDPSIAVRDERSSVPRLNQYDRTENHDPGTGTFIQGLRVNPDEDANLGADYTYWVQGFKKQPFAARHLVSARFVTATLGATLEYRGLFPESVGLFDQDAEISLHAPTVTRNFFGYTNAFVDTGKPLDFYRVRQALVEARYGLSHAYGGERTRVGAQLLAQAIVTEATPGRFVTASPDVKQSDLGPRYFAGAQLFVQSHTFDRLTQPTHGVGVRLSLESRFDALQEYPVSTNYRAVAAGAFPFDRKHRFVLQSRVSLEGIVGAHRFYFSPTLGDTELRAYHSQQLAGDVAFAQTTDLRIELFHVAGVIGLNLSVDHGRVFGPSISSNAYHLSLGGSIWWTVLDTMGLSVGYYRGLDGGGAFRLSVGPMFASSVL